MSIKSVNTGDLRPAILKTRTETIDDFGQVKIEYIDSTIRCNIMVDKSSSLKQNSGLNDVNTIMYKAQIRKHNIDIDTRDLIEFTSYLKGIYSINDMYEDLEYIYLNLIKSVNIEGL